MDFAETLYECWITLKNELLKEEIYSIEKFMNYIFTSLFLKLNKEESIDDYDKLIKFESELESHIQKVIKDYKKENDDSNKNNNNDSTSFVNLLKEKYPSSNYDKKEFPFYEYFYYTDYLNETNINEKLKYMDEDKYPVLKKYLVYLNNNKVEEENYSLDNLNLINRVLNLFYEKYSNHISRVDAEKKILKNEDIYINNKDLIDSFIAFFNNLKIKNPEKKLELSNNSYLIDFFITDNKFGKIYKDIYNNLIKEQNKRIEDLLAIKIQNGIFDDSCLNKINVQQINEKEIFTTNLPKEISFIDILFNSSYRKILDNDNRSYESYKEYKINYDLIEENMTDLLLKNKKLLNDGVFELIYNNELFGHVITDSITLFKKRYVCKNIDIYNKENIYKFCIDNKGNNYICKDTINNFVTLIKFLNDKRKDNINEDDIKEETKIYEVIDKLKDKISDNFIKLFDKQEGLTVDKTSGIFEYYLKLIYEDVNDEINKYQIELNENSKNIINDYYQKSNHIKRKDFAQAIRIFMTLVLFLEDDKENKIKSNHNNIINYLKSPDLWSKDTYEEPNFYLNLNELKSADVKINQIIHLYEFLGKDIEDNAFEDVKKNIQEEENQKESKDENNLDDEEEDDPFGEKDDDERGV